VGVALDLFEGAPVVVGAEWSVLRAVVADLASVDLVGITVDFCSVLFEAAAVLDFDSVLFAVVAVGIDGFVFVALVGFIPLAAGFFGGDAVGKVESNFGEVAGSFSSKGCCSVLNDGGACRSADGEVTKSSFDANSCAA